MELNGDVYFDPEHTCYLALLESIPSAARVIAIFKDGRIVIDHPFSYIDLFQCVADSCLWFMVH